MPDPASHQKSTPAKQQLRGKMIKTIAPASFVISARQIEEDAHTVPTMQEYADQNLTYSCLPQQRLNLMPLPQPQGSFLPCRPPR